MALAPIHDLVVERLTITPGERVLDVGTGTGEVALRAFRAGGDVVGVDISDDQLAKARATAPGVEFVEADCQEMGFADGSFDVVASVFGFVFAPDHTRAGAELARVSAPGARLALTSWTYDDFSEVGERLGRPFPPGEDSREWSNEEHARERLAGFDLRFERHVWEMREESADAMWEEIRASVPPLKNWLDSVDEAERERAKAAYVAVFPDGVLRRDFVLILGTRR